MIPEKLYISGFLSYHHPVELDFSSIELACIAGSNGAGKSSILDAITWSLFGQARRRDDSIINTRSEIAEVSFTFFYEGNSYKVIRTSQRGKATKLEFQIKSLNVFPSVDPSRQNDDVDSSGDSDTWKTLSERTLRGTQKSIEDTLRLDYETFVNAAFFLQGKADLFTTQRPANRKKILASILGLEVWDTYRSRAIAQRKKYEEEVLSLDGRLAEILAELSEEDTRVNRLADLEGALEQLSAASLIQESNLENLKKVVAALKEQRKFVDSRYEQLESNRKRFADLETRLDIRQAEKGTYTEILSKKTDIQAAYRIWCESRESLAKWDEIANQFREHEKQREVPRLEIESERARLEQEIKTLKAEKLTINDLVSSMPVLEEKVKAQDLIILELGKEIEMRKSVENELQTAQETHANARAENPLLKKEMDDLKTRIEKLEDTDGAACPTCGQPLDTEEREKLIDTLNMLGKTMGDKYRANQKLLIESGDHVNRLKREIDDKQDLDDKLLKEKDILNKTNTQIEHIQNQKQSWKKKDAPRLEEITKIIENKSFGATARSKLALIDAELKGIGYDASEHDNVRRLEREGRTTEDDFRSVEKAEAALGPLDNDIENLKSDISEHLSSIKKLTEEYDQAAIKFAAEEAQAPDLEKAQRDFLDTREEENKVRLEVGAARQKVLVLEDLKNRRRSLENEREDFAQKIGQYKQLERAFGKDGVPALLIESALPQIENKANEILDRLSGGSMRVSFITQREYKDKSREDMMETLDIQISDSIGRREYEMFSGGEAFRVNFAIRLALAEVLAQRAGARLQTLVIDEGFGSQDAIGRQRLIETINTVKPDFAKILVITHIDSMKDAFPTRIEVEKTPEGSMVSIL